MNFLTFGSKGNKSVLFIHGMASSAKLCYEPLLTYLKDYYVILTEADGHSDSTPEFESLVQNCEEIEQFVSESLNGELYCLSGFSMGATMAVDIAARRNISISKLHLDAAFLIKMGWRTKPYEMIFCKSIARILSGKRIPKVLMDSVMGKDNNSVVEMLYSGIASKTIISACEYVYNFEIADSVKLYSGSAAFWYGSNEPYPRKSAELLKEYLPNLEVVEFDNMGHGQLLHEHKELYADKLIDFLKK